MGYCGNWCWWIITIFATILMSGKVTNSCWDHERDALLQLYSSVPHPVSDYFNGWKDAVNNKTSNCCEWNGVTCGDNSRITSLTLEILTGSEVEWHVNASIFLPFEDLRELVLSENNIVTWTEDKGCTKLSSKLINLQELVLSGNQLNSTILLHLSGFRSLKRLDLSSNQLAKAIQLQDIEAISKKIEELDLSDNEITSILDYNGCDEPKQRSQFNGNTSRLNVLLQSLRRLDLSNNKFSGEIPLWFRNLTNLEKLDLPGNQFTGNIGSSPLIHLLYLKWLDISYNHLQIPVSFQSFENHTKLKQFFGDFNRVVHDDVPKINVQPLSMGLQLEVLTLANFGAFTFPSFLHLQHSLRIIDLSNNVIDEEFPTWLLENNFELEAIFLTNSSITGSLQLPSLTLPNMTIIKFGNNKIQGHIPHDIGVVFPNLIELDLSNNILEGNISSSLSDLKSLEYVYLSNNHLFGKIEVISKRCINLRTLDLSHNDFEGDLPSFRGLTSFESLILQGNNFVGSFSMNFFGPNLQFLDLSYNFIEGSIPNDICNNNVSFEVLDLSFNKLSGPLPNCSIEASSLYLNNNRLSGNVPNAFLRSSMGFLDLSYNELNGPLPAAISNLTNLHALALRGNQFHGPIPHQLCELTGLNILDLSSNKFQGTIPTCLAQILDQNHGFIDAYEIQDQITMSSELRRNFIYPNDEYEVFTFYDKVDFTTKYNAYRYNGTILRLMTGIDLSCNNLTGQLPHELGNLSNLRGLNVSRNNLWGDIPTEFSNLKNLESLDLSYNHLSGSIPIELTKLYALAVFQVSYNNLSGKIPSETGQLSTFDASSYYGNPFLCGRPLSKNCNADESPIINKNVSKDMDDEHSDWSDKEIFYVTFAVSGVTVFLAVVIMMQINQNWLNASYFLVKKCITSTYCFIEDNIRKLRRVRHA